MSYAWFARNDIILSLLIIGLFIYVCDILVTYIVANKTKTPIRPVNYIFGILKG